MAVCTQCNYAPVSSVTPADDTRTSTSRPCTQMVACLPQHAANTRLTWSLIKTPLPKLIQAAWESSGTTSCVAKDCNSSGGFSGRRVQWFSWSSCQQPGPLSVGLYAPLTGRLDMVYALLTNLKGLHSL